MEDNKQIFLIPISEERKIAVLNIDFKELKIIYRNIGKDFDIRIKQEANIRVTDKNIEILGETGDRHTYFPRTVLDITSNMIQELVEIGVLKFK
jgi:hypothetical protein